MMYSEKVGNLFEAPRNYALVHAISADFILGAGVAKEIDRLYNMREALCRMYNEGDLNNIGQAIYIDGVYSLVVKNKHYDDIQYSDLEEALWSLRDMCMEELATKHLAMPRLCCGHGHLEWVEVRSLIKHVFEDTDLDIVVYGETEEDFKVCEETDTHDDCRNEYDGLDSDEDKDDYDEDDYDEDDYDEFIDDYDEDEDDYNDKEDTQVKSSDDFSDFDRRFKYALNKTFEMMQLLFDRSK